MRSRRAVTTLVAAVLCAAAAPAAAQPLDPVHQLSVGDEQGRAPATAGGRDRVLTVWPDDGAGITGRFTDGGGAPLGDPFDVALDGAFETDVAYSATQDAFLVVYRREVLRLVRGIDPSEGIYGRRIGADGTLGPEFVVSDDGGASDPNVAWSADRDEFLVVWNNGDDLVDGRLVSGEGVPDPDGSVPLGGEAGRSDSPDVAHDDGADRWLVVFRHEDPAPETERSHADVSIDGAVFDAELSPVGGTTISAHDAEAVRDPAVVSLGDDEGWLVAFTADANRRARIHTATVGTDGQLTTPAAVVPEADTVLLAADAALARDRNTDDVLLTYGRNEVTPGTPDDARSHVARNVVGRLLPADGTLGDALVIGEETEDQTREHADADVAWLGSSCTFVPAWIGFDDDSDGVVLARGWDGADCPVPPRNEQTGPNPPAQQQSQGPPVTTTVPSVAPRQCRSRRAFTIRVRRYRGRRYVSAQVRVNGRLVRTVFGRRVTAPVRLTGLPRGRFTVSIVARTADGRTFRGTRRYRTCVPRRAGGIPLL